MKNLLTKLFGRIIYQPPGWIERPLGLVIANGRKALTGIIAVAVGGAILWGGYQAYQKRQLGKNPDYVTARVYDLPSFDFKEKKPRHLTIRFSRSVAPTSSIGKPVKDGISISPKIEGVWTWASDQALSFTPQSDSNGLDWPIGQDFTVKFQKSLLASHVLMESYQVDFKTEPLTARTQKEEFYLDPNVPANKRVVVTFSFNFPIEPESFKKHIRYQALDAADSEISNPFAKVGFSVSFNENKTQAYLQSDPLPLISEDVRLGFLLEKGTKGAWGGKLEDGISGHGTVPGQDTYLQVNESHISIIRNEKYEPEQILVIETKAPLPSEKLAENLKVFVLPKLKPKQSWKSAAEVDAKTLGESTPLVITTIPTEETNSMVHTYKIKVDPKRYLFLKVSKGLESYGGYKLADDYANVIDVPEYSQELMIMSSGSILQMSGEKRLPILSRNVSKVKYTIARIRPEHLNLFATQIQYTYAKPSSYPVTFEKMAEFFEGEIEVGGAGPADTNYLSVDLNNYLDKQASLKKGLFFITLKAANRDNPKIFTEMDQRLIAVTDLGFIAKLSNGGGHTVFIQNIRTGSPVSGAKVDVIGQNGIPVISVSTDAQGQAFVPDLKDLKKEKFPTAFVVQNQGDLAIFPFKANSQMLDFSRFDTGGIYESSLSDSLTSYLFTDRGLYRPGETARLGLIVRSKNWKKTFSGIPLMLRIFNSRSEKVVEEILKFSSHDLSSFDFKTYDYSPTGYYTAELLLVGAKKEAKESIGSLNFRVEEFLPDQMKISSSFSKIQTRGWVAPTGLKGQVQVYNLYGKPAEKREVRTQVRFVPTSPSFPEFKEFSFARNNTRVKELADELGPFETGSDGRVEFDLPVGSLESALYRLVMTSEAFETSGGRSVKASSSQLVSDFDTLIGFKSLSNLSYLKKGVAADVEFIAINSDLKKVGKKDLSLDLFENKYVSTLVKQDDGTYKYQSVLKEILKDSKPFSISEKGMNIPLPVETAGDFTYVIKNQKGIELNRVGFNVVGESNLARGLERSSELVLGLNKKDYDPGDEISIQVKAPYVGAGLITIERDKVYAHKWFRSSTESFTENIKIPPGVEGNAYVVVTFLRDAQSKEIYVSPLAYAAHPFSISLDSHRIDLKITAPDRVKPGEKAKFSITASRPASVVVYGVDEGILQVANYKTPDPLGYFFQRKALQVTTYQLLDLIMPEFSLLQSPSGDESTHLGNNLNPFKRKGQPPVVFWNGPIKMGAETRAFDFLVPDYYNGNIKLMAVATTESLFGQSAENLTVRGDYIITATAPTFVAPGDEFEVSMIVANQKEGSGPQAKLNVESEISSAFSSSEELKRTLDVPEGREASLNFKVKAGNTLGSFPIQISVGQNGVKAKQKVELSIRPPQLFYSDVTARVFKGNTDELSLRRQVRDELKSEKLFFSLDPMGMARGFVEYLAGVDLLCTEQLASRLTALLIDKNNLKSSKLDDYNAVIAQLRTRQRDDGGFSLYDNGESDPSATLHVAQILIEAKDKGKPVPEGLFSSLGTYLKNKNLVGNESTEDFLFVAKSAYLLSRMGLTPMIHIKNLKAHIKAKPKAEWIVGLPGAYFAAVSLLSGDTEDGKIRFSKIDLGKLEFQSAWDYYQFLAPFAEYFNLAVRHFPSTIVEIQNSKTYSEFLNTLSNGYVNTYLGAMSLLALDSWSARMKNLVAQGKVTVTFENGQGTKVAAGEPFDGGFKIPKGATKVKVQKETSDVGFYSVIQSGFDVSMPTKEIQRKLELTRSLLSLDGKPVQKVKIGEEIKVEIFARTPEIVGQNVVVADLFPGGFDPVLSSLRPQLMTESPTTESESEENYIPPAEEVEEEGWNLQFPKLIERAFAVEGADIQPMITRYLDVREDRVVLYTLLTQKMTRFEYKLKAVSKGKFIVPPITAKGLYNPTVFYQGVSGTIEVE